MELEQRIKQEIEENPALEEGAEKDEEDEFDNEDLEDETEEDFDISDYLADDADYKTQVNNKGKDEDEKAVPLSGDQSFQERLSKQLQLRYLEDDQYLIADTIIEYLAF